MFARCHFGPPATSAKQPFRQPPDHRKQGKPRLPRCWSERDEAVAKFIARSCPRIPEQNNRSVLPGFYCNRPRQGTVAVLPLSHPDLLLLRQTQKIVFLWRLPL